MEWEKLARKDPALVGTKPCKAVLQNLPKKPASTKTNHSQNIHSAKPEKDFHIWHLFAGQKHKNKWRHRIERMRERKKTKS